MKVHIEVFLESNDLETMNELQELVDSIKFGSFQRSLEKKSAVSKEKDCRVKATVDVTY
jgi:hypothetical protein